MTDITLPAINKIPEAILDLPGSKSIANRVLLLAGLSSGVSIIHNVPSNAEDVGLMLSALQELGIKCVDVSVNNNVGIRSYQITGCNGVFPTLTGNIFCGNSGTTIRFLSAALALQPGNYKVDGISRMRERPIQDLVAALKQIGANIDYLMNPGYPPLQISPFLDNNNSQICVSGKISSQYLTGILIAVVLLKRKIHIKVTDELISKPYVEITLNLLNNFGITVHKLDDNNYEIDTTNQFLKGIEYTIEPDASSASYFLAIGAIKGTITVNNLHKKSLQGDKNFAQVLEMMGAQVTYHDNAISVMAGVKMLSSNKLKAIKLNMEDMPDVAMTIAVMAIFADGITTITGIHSWKVKETDRLVAMQNELSKLGATVSITNDSICINPPDKIKHNVEINTYNDHRMAMCFSLLPVYGIPIIIRDYACVNKTFPTYFELFQHLCYTILH